MCLFSRCPTPSACRLPARSSTASWRASCAEIVRAGVGHLRHLIDDGEVKGRRGKVTFVHTDGRVSAHRIGTAGVGRLEQLDADSLRTAAAAAAVRAGDVGARSVAWVVGDNSLALTPGEQVKAIVDGTALGPYDSGHWKTSKEDSRPEVERLILCGPGAAAATEEARRAAVVASWTNRCRDFVKVRSAS